MYLFCVYIFCLDLEVSSGARKDQATCFDPTTAIAWIFGGDGVDISGGMGMLDGLWEYAQIWERAGGDTVVDSLGSAAWPSAREHSAMWCTSAGLYLFGGSGFVASGSVEILSDMWLYTSSTGAWSETHGSELTSSGSGSMPSQHSIQYEPSPTTWPGSRAEAAHWVDAYGHLWIFAGKCFPVTGPPGPAWCDDMWFYDGTDWVWVGGLDVDGGYGEYWSQGVSSPDNWAGSRAGATANVDKYGVPYIFGGLGHARFLPLTELNDMWAFLPMCTDGLTFSNSSTVCDGHISEKCDYSCHDGFAEDGEHVCEANGFRSNSFVGGKCAASFCATPVLTQGQIILEGCEANGTMGMSTCSLGCQDGYNASYASTVGTCRAVENSTAASYQGQRAECIASTCRSVLQGPVNAAAQPTIATNNCDQTTTAHSLSPHSPARLLTDHWQRASALQVSDIL